MTKPLEIVNRFFALTDVQGRHVPDLLPAIRDLLTGDIAFSGPLMKTEGRDQYLGLLGQFLPATWAIASCVNSQTATKFVRSMR